MGVGLGGERQRDGEARALAGLAEGRQRARLRAKYKLQKIIEENRER